MTTAAGVLETCGRNSSLLEADFGDNDTRPESKVNVKTLIEFPLPILTIRSRAARPVSVARVPQKLRANLSIQAALPQQHDPHTRTPRSDHKPPEIPTDRRSQEVVVKPS
jgi:hypothetical protein